MTGDQNSQKMLMGGTHIVDIEFSVDPQDLFHGWCVYSYLHAKKHNHMKKLPPELPIPFRMVHKERIKLNRLGS